MIRAVRLSNGIRVRFTQKEIEKVANAVLRAEKIFEASISVIFVDDKFITAINKKFLRHNYTTDVITFPLETEKEISAEIYINVLQAKRQAKEFGVSLKNELLRLIVHGILHTVGYDDIEIKEQTKMIRKQEQYVAILQKQLHRK